MRAWSLSILFLVLGLSLGQINYATLSSFSGCTTAPSGHLKSPIVIENSLCGPYGTFDVTLPSVNSVAPTFDQQYGAPSIPYPDAKLTYNGTTYTSQVILVRYKSENELFGVGEENAEIQIIMNGAKEQAVLSFIVSEIGNNPGYSNSYQTSKVVQSLATAGWTFNLELLEEQIMAKPKEEQFLNIFRYEGTLTYPTNNVCDPAVWYVYGRPLFVDSLADLKTLLQDSATNNQVVLNSDGGNSRATTGTNGGSGAHSVQRLCYSGYFTNYLGDNYGLWFGIVIILLFFIVTLFMSDIPITDPDYQESIKTIHPLYSIWVVGNEIFTKKSRSALVLMTLTIHALFSSTWYRQSGHRTRGSNIIVYAIYSMLISWAYTYLLGNILRRYYIAKYHYCKTRDESWNQKAQNRIFAYYTAVFATICIAWPFCVWNMQELLPQVDNKASNYWVATFFVGLGLEFLVADILCVLLCRSSNFLKKISRAKGYMYDNMCHETYLNALKMD